MKPTLSAIRRRAIAQFAREHPEVSFADIAIIFNVNKSFVSTICSLANVQRPRGAAAPSYPREILHNGVAHRKFDHAAILAEVRKDDSTYFEIGDKFGCDYTTVYSVAAAAGIHRKRGRRFSK